MSSFVQELPSTEEVVATTREIAAAFRHDPGGLIPALQQIQHVYGYLPESALQTLALELAIPYSEVAGVVTFYSYFTTVPRGRHVVRVCLGTACYVRGGKEVLEAIKNELGIDVGQTTEDRTFSLEIGRCFGACGLAPVVVIDDTVHQRVGPACVGSILDQYRDVGDEAAVSTSEVDEEVQR